MNEHHLSPETKFENADFLHRGRTERWHIVATGIVLIGKEVNRIGPSGEIDPVASRVVEFFAETERTTSDAQIDLWLLFPQDDTLWKRYLL